MTKTEELMTENAKAAQEIIARNAKEVDRERRFPRENITALGRCRVLGLLVPVEHGGAGGGLAEMSRALEQLAQACPSTAMVVLMHFCGTAVIAAKGSAKLKQALLPAIARGEHLTTLAFSEPGSGGHFYFPVSQARPNGHGFFLNANKSFVTSAGEADSYVVSTRAVNAKTPQESALFLVDKRAADASLAVVSRAMTLGGGAAYASPGGLERIFRDAQAASVMAPTTDVLKDFLGKAALGLPLL